MDYIELTKKAIELGAIQKDGELRLLLSFLRSKKLSKILEIGTAKGGIFYALCQLAEPNATIISVDMPGGAFGGGYTKKDMKRFKEWNKGKQTLVFIPHDSHDERTKQKVVNSIQGKLDLLFIDGDHTYEGVKKDWLMYSPLVKEGGIIVFHDICFHKKIPTCQVEKFWKEIREDYHSREFIDPIDTTWGGIGVIEYYKSKLQSKKGLLVDINPIPNKQKGFLGMSNKVHANVDVIHDPEKFPYPFEDNSCHIVMARYLLQRIRPWDTIKFMDELWRIIKPNGQLALSVPYGGSPAFYADPLACNGCNETTFYYFDPRFGDLYSYYEPKPWEIEAGSPQWIVGANIEVLMRPIK